MEEKSTKNHKTCPQFTVERAATGDFHNICIYLFSFSSFHCVSFERFFFVNIYNFIFDFISYSKSEIRVFEHSHV